MAKRTRPIAGVQRRYVWRLYPTPEQQIVLHNQAAMCADLWNALLEINETIHRRKSQHGGWVFHNSGPRLPGAEGAERQHRPSEFDMGYWITQMLAECPEWRALSTWTPRRVATSLDAAFKAFFRRLKEGLSYKEAGYPRFKSRRRADSIPHRCISGCMIKKSDRHLRSWTVRLKGVPGEIWARGMVPAEIDEWTDLDIMHRNGKWEASCAMSIAPRRPGGGNRTTVIHFNLIDGLAKVNDELETPDGLIAAQSLQDYCQQMQSNFDKRWPHGRRLSDDERMERQEDRIEISRLSARIARIRRNALHVWTSRLVEMASDMTVIVPPIKKHTKSPRGDKDNWGAEIETVSAINRNTLSFAPALAVQMLEYKAKEAGIRCDVITDTAPVIGVGADLVTAGKTERRARRIIRKKTHATV